MKESGQGQTSAVEGGGEEGSRVGGSLPSALRVKSKAAKINKDTSSERRALQ